MFLYSYRNKHIHRRRTLLKLCFIDHLDNKSALRLTSLHRFFLQQDKIVIAVKILGIANPRQMIEIESKVKFKLAMPSQQTKIKGVTI